MPNLFLILLFIVINYLFFLFEEEDYFFSLVKVPFLYKITEKKPTKKGVINYNYNVNIEEDVKISIGLKINRKPQIRDNKILLLRKDLNDNLKYLEFLLTFENQLICLASKNNYNLENLEEYIKTKKKVQLKIILLSQSIAYYQSKKINLC